MKLRKNDKKTIKDELDQLKKIEGKLSLLEKHRSRLEARLLKDATGSPKLLKTKHARRGLGSYALVRFRRRQLAYYLVTTLGVLMIWVGAWEVIERVIPNPWISVAGGLVIIWVTRYYH